jgi:hypothetical protein
MPPKVAVPDVATMVSDINEMNLFIKRQGEQARDCTSLAQTHAGKFCAKVASMALTAAQANTMQTAFDNGSFTDEQKTTFADALASAIGGNGGSQSVVRGGGGSSPCAQKIQIEFYIPEVFMNTVLPNDAIDIAIKTQHFANLFMALECMYADESSRGRAAILLGTIGLNNANPTVDTLHHLHNDLADAINNLRKGFTPKFPHLPSFPTDVAALGDERLTHAYADVRPMAPPNDVKLHLQRFVRVPFLRSTASGVSRGARAGRNPRSDQSSTATSQSSELLDSVRTLLQGFQDMAAGRRAPSLRDRADAGGDVRGGSRDTMNRSLTGFDRRQPLPLTNGGSFMDGLKDTPGKRSQSPMDGGREPAGRSRTRSVRRSRTRSRDRRRRDEARVRSPNRTDDHPSALADAAATAAAVAAAVAAKRKATKPCGKKKDHVRAAAKAAAKSGGLKDDEESECTREDESETDSDNEASKLALKRKPAAARAVRPASLAKEFKDRPKVMDGTEANPPATLFWGGGKLTMSFSKKGYRSFPDLSVGNPVDRCFKWATYGSKKLAWSAALDHIKEANYK